MDKRAVDFVLTLVLICAVGYLIYLDWLRQGELDFLAEEVSKVRRWAEPNKTQPPEKIGDSIPREEA